jgi:hypothetical protein
LHEPCDLPLQPSVLSELIDNTEFPLDINGLFYSIKVYGEEGINNSVSKLSSYTNQKLIWNINEAIDILWNKYSERIIEKEFKSFSDIVDISRYFNLTFSTIPYPAFFKGAKYSISYIYTIPTIFNENIVHYDTSIQNHIYRYGTMYKTFFAESTERVLPNMLEVRKVVPVALEYPKLEDRKIVFAGRYSEWNKDVLAHDVYSHVRKVLQ